MITYMGNGALAQLVARNTGSVEVTGSNPVCSTKQCFLEHLIELRSDGNTKQNGELLFMQKCSPFSFFKSVVRQILHRAESADDRLLAFRILCQYPKRHIVGRQGI